MTDRTLLDSLRTLKKRVGLLERRIAVGAFRLPPRLQPAGQEVTDWNNATQAGFYWSQSGAANNPVGNIAVGAVIVKGEAPNARVFQEVYFPTSTDSSRMQTWRRVNTAADGSGAWSAWAYSNPVIPDPQWLYGPSATTLTGGAGSWQLIAGGPLTITPARALWVDVAASAIMKASTGYSMLGINITGGVVLGPDAPPDGGSPASHWTPFTSSTVDAAVMSPVKRILLPAGVATNFMIYARRNVGSGTHTCNYPMLTLNPVRWA